MERSWSLLVRVGIITGLAMCNAMITPRTSASCFAGNGSYVIQW